MINGADLDHVALAAESSSGLAGRYAAGLGGRPGGSGSSPGFRWSQVSFSNGMIVEMLEPDRIGDNDFLRRFLDRNGPGPHHLTFKVPDFGTALAAAEEAGFTPVGVNTSDPSWKEAFLHPRDAPGIVVQLAESHEHPENREHPETRDPTPAGAEPPPASLVRVAHAVRSLDAGSALFERLLGGRPAAAGGGDGTRWVDLTWPGPGRIRLLEPTGPGALDRWIGDRPGRLHHLAFLCAHPGAVTDAEAEGRVWRVGPDRNLGTRLLLAGPDQEDALSGPGAF